MTIARYAFQNCYRSSWSGTNTWNLVLPSTVKTISSYAFQWCNAFPTITVKGSGVAIEENGFYYCYAPSLVIDGSVKTVGQYGFRYAQFTALTFPNGLESLGYEAFYNCASSPPSSFPIPSPAWGTIASRTATRWRKSPLVTDSR